MDQRAIKIILVVVVIAAFIGGWYYYFVYTVDPNATYVKKFNDMGCTTTVVSQAQVDYWKNETRDDGESDRMAYCTFTKNGTATPIQKDTCCGKGINCKPAC